MSSINSVSGVSFRGDQPQQGRGTSPIVPAFVLGTAAGVGSYYGLKSPMTQDEFKSSLKEGKEIKYAKELTKEEQKDIEKLTKEVKAEKPEETKETKETKENSKPEKTETKTAPKSKAKLTDAEKEINNIFGKNEEISPSKYLEARYGKPKKGTALENLTNMISKAEAQNEIPKAKKGETPVATLASNEKAARASVADAQKLSDAFNTAQETEKAAVEAEAKAAAEGATKEEKVAAGKARTAAKNAAKKLDAIMPKEIKDQVEAAMNAKPEEVRTLGTKSVGATETAKAIKARIEAANKEVATAEAATAKNAAEIAKMKADLEIVKPLKKGEKITKAAISESYASVEKAVESIESKAKPSTLETVFKAVSEKLPKVKSWKKASIIGASVAVAVGLIAALTGGKKEEAPEA